MKRLAGVALLIVAAGLLTAAPAAADETSCSSDLGAVQVDNLRVPDGENCSLDGTSITGSLVVGRGATLTATNIDAHGNLQAEGARSVDVSTSRIGGSVQLKQGGAASVASSFVKGDIQLEAHSGPLITKNNEVGGSIQIVKNLDVIDVTGNAVDGNLQCKENATAPAGGSNSVQGNKEDQCAAL